MSRQLLNACFLWYYAKWLPAVQFSLHSFKELFGFGWKLLVSELINTVWKEMYQVIIGKCYSAQMLGQYTRSKQFASIFSTNLTTVIQRVSYPVLSSIQDDKERLKLAYQRVIKVAMLVTFICMIGLAAIAKPMIVVLIGEKWLVAATLLPVICFNMMLYPLHALNLNMLQVQGRSDLFLKLEIAKKIIAVIPVLFGLFINIYWMLWGSVFTGFIAYYLNAYYSGKILNYSISMQLKDIYPSLGIAVMMGGVVYSVSFLPLSPFVLLPIQLFVGAITTWGLCEIIHRDEYVEIKMIILSVLQKIKNGK